MRCHLVLIPAMFALFPLSAGAQELSQGDRDRVLSHLHGTRKLTLDATAGLTEAQWKFKPADDKWSIAEVVEHLALAERALLAMTQKTLASPSQLEPPKERPADEMILKMMPSRDNKFKAPDFLVPTGRFGSGQKALDELIKARAVSLDFVRQTNADLRHHYSQSAFGPIDGVQWLFYMSAHNERHLGQIAEIKTDSKYPR